MTLLFFLSMPSTWLALTLIAVLCGWLSSIWRRT